MTKYQVDMQEVHLLSIEVEADSIEEAREIAKAKSVHGDGSAVDEGYLEYSHTARPEEWEVRPLLAHPVVL